MCVFFKGRLGEHFTSRFCLIWASGNGKTPFKGFVMGTEYKNACHTTTKSFSTVFLLYSGLYRYSHLQWHSNPSFQQREWPSLYAHVHWLYRSIESQFDVWLCQKHTAGPFPASWGAGQLKQMDKRLSSSKTTRSLALEGAVHDIWWRWMKVVATVKDRTLQVLWRSFRRARSHRAYWHGVVHVVVEQSGICACLM